MDALKNLRLLSLQLGFIGMGPNLHAAAAAPPPGGSVTWVDSIADDIRADSAATVSATGSDGLNPSGSNRLIIGAIHTNEFGTQATHNDMGLGALSLVQQGTTQNYAGGFNSLSLWAAVAPSTGLQNASGDVSAAQAAIMIVMAAYENVNQTTPITLGTPATGNFTTTSGVASTTITASAGQKVGAIIGARDSNAGPVTFATSSGSAIRNFVSGAAFNTSGMCLAEVTSAGGSTTIAAALSVPVADAVDWCIIPFTYNEV